MNISRITTYTNFSKNKFSNVSLTSKQLDKMATAQKFNTAKCRPAGTCDDGGTYVVDNHAGEWC